MVPSHGPSSCFFLLLTHLVVLSSSAWRFDEYSIFFLNLQIQRNIFYLFISKIVYSNFTSICKEIQLAVGYRYIGKRRYNQQNRWGRGTQPLFYQIKLQPSITYTYIHSSITWAFKSITINHAIYNIYIKHKFKLLMLF